MIVQVWPIGGFEGRSTIHLVTCHFARRAHYVDTVTEDVARRRIMEATSSQCLVCEPLGVLDFDRGVARDS